MTDPDASGGRLQPTVTEPALPDSTGDPRTQGAANPPDDLADASPQPISKEVPACGFASGIEDSASRFEIVPACPTGQIYGLAQYLDGFADTIAQAQAALLASAIPKLSIADAFPVLGLQAMSKMAIPPGLELFKPHLPAVSLAASLRDLGFLQGVSTMVNSWDHGLLGINRQLAESAATLAAPHQALIRSVANLAAIRTDAFSSLVDFAAVSATAGLVGLFRSWRETAETGLGLLRGLAVAAYRAALRAREAVLNGDDGPVTWFIEAWLHMRVTPGRIEAVSAALLEEGWDADIPEDLARLLTDLRIRTVRQARVLRPIWETQLNYRTIGRLDHTVASSNGTLLTVADLVPDPQTTEDLVLANECEEQRLRRVLSRLKPEELRVTNVYAGHSELTWAEAARLAGAADPDAMGERVRRKLKRLGAEHNRRLVQTGGV
jgi:hypothetical protein